jgi:transposase
MSHDPNAPPSSETTSPTRSSSTPPRPTRGRKPSPEQCRQVLYLHEQGYGTRAIARRVLLNRKAVQRLLRQTGHDPLPPPRPTAASKLDPFREAIAERVHKRLTTTRILREIRELGYTGGRTILSQYVGQLQGPLAPRKPVKRRFETRPGEEMQVDWSVYTVLVAGEPERVHALGCVLCYSRYLHVRFYRDERESTLLEGLARAFEAFQGVCQRTVFDNMATVVLARIGPHRKPVWHPRFLDFARHYGTQPFLCKVRDPDRKGKGEAIFALLERDLLRGSVFASFEELNQRAETWLREVANRRVHGTTGLVPEEAWLAERDFLIRLPERRFAVYQEGIRSIDEDSTVSLGGRRYTVPSTLPHGPVAVRLYAEHFELLDRSGQVAFARRYAEPSDPKRLQLDPAHYAALPQPAPGPHGRRIDELFLERFPGLAGLVEGIERRMKSLAHVHLRALWRLAEAYGEEAFLKAAERAQQYRRHDSHAVRRLLERHHPLRASTPSVLPVGDAARVHALLGEVDPGSLQSYAHLDTVEATADPGSGLDSQRNPDDGSAPADLRPPDEEVDDEA